MSNPLNDVISEFRRIFGTSKFTDDAMDFNRIEPIKPTPIPLHDLSPKGKHK